MGGSISSPSDGRRSCFCTRVLNDGQEPQRVWISSPTFFVTQVDTVDTNQEAIEKKHSRETQVCQRMRFRRLAVMACMNGRMRVETTTVHGVEAVAWSQGAGVARSPGSLRSNVLDKF